MVHSKKKWSIQGVVLLHDKNYGLSHLKRTLMGREAAAVHTVLTMLKWVSTRLLEKQF